MKDSASSYRVGSHVFRIVNRTAIDLAGALPSLSPFATSAAADEDELFELNLTDTDGRSITENSDTDICFDWEDARCIIRPLTDDNHIIAITPRNTEKTYCMKCADKFRRCTAYLSAGEEAGEETTARSSVESFVLNNFLMMLYAFTAARRHTLLMHASVIAYGGKGYLFLGKSGTGKSTHTGLWLRHIPECHLLNDDNPVVHVDEASRTATVYGSPWSGKTPCYRNESMPVGAFVRLEQAPQNEIKREGAAHAFADLLPSCSCLKQDREIYGGVRQAITELIFTAPVFHLKCLPNQEAAEYCCRTVTS